MQEKYTPLEHLQALLADRALQGADPAEQAGINCLLQHQPEESQESFELTAAAVDMAYSTTQHEPLPAHLLSKLQTQGEAIAADNSQRKHVEPMRTAVGKPMTSSRLKWSQALGYAGWVAAATLLVAFLIPKPDISTEAAYLNLKQKGALEVKGEAGPGDEKKQIAGEVLWDDKLQTGYMKLRGMPVNSPDKSQYQLWIFDSKPFSKDNPTDGGVFDVNKDGEVIIPIKPNLKVSKPELFAITVEQPGGVMVSKREKIVFVASVPK